MVNEVEKNNFDFEKHMRLAQDGDKRAYEKILKNILPIIKAFIYKFDYRNLLDVDAISQEALIAIHKSSQTYNCDRPFKTWALAITKFKIKDELRVIYRKKKLNQVDFADVENQIFEEVDFMPEKTQNLESMLHVLKPKQQEIVRFLKIDGNSLQEVANKIDMSVSGVKISAHRAYKILTKKFGPKND